MRTRRNRQRICGIPHVLETLESRLLLTINIVFDYDTLGSASFFTPERRAALNHAADAFETRLTNSLAAIPISAGQFNTWQPAPPAANGGAITLPPRTIPANTVVIYLGAANYSGGTAGQGGTGILISSFESDGTSITQNGVDWIELLVHRGNEVDEYSTWGGAVYFDSSDRDWYAGIDETGISEGQTDFILTAQHEIAHVLGFSSTNVYRGIATANPTLNMGALRNREYGWDLFANGNSFSGPNSRLAWDGTGNVPIIGDHWQETVTSDGVETLLDPTAEQGEIRKRLTTLDWAGLDDVGWDVIYPPSVSLTVDGTTGSPVTVTETDANFTIPAVIRRSVFGGDLSGNLVVSLTSSDTSAVTVPATVTIPSNQPSATFDVTIRPDADFDDETIQLTALSAVATNGRQVFDIQITDDEIPSLTWTISPTTVTESVAGSTISNVRINRTGPVSSTPTVVTLTSPDPSELTFDGASTLTVTIPANATQSDPFAINVEDDTVFDGDITVQLRAAADGFAPVLQPVVVRDNELPTLTVGTVPALREGDDFTDVTISRNTSEGVANVVLAADPASEVDIEDTTLQIPAGETSVVFRVRARDDSAFDGSVDVVLTATASGNNSGSRTIQTTDNEVASLTWTISPTAVTESAAGSTISNVRINRTGPVSSTPTVVTVTSPDPSELTFDGASTLTVTIPADATQSEPFTITVEDDTAFDGDVTVQLTANAAGFAAVSQPVVVRDNELPTLTVGTAPALAEGDDFTEVTVSRNTSEGVANVVLSADPAAEVDIEDTTLQIPDGETSVVFRVRARDDSAFDGTVDVVLTATASGNNSGSRTIQTTDNEVPQLSFSVSPTSVGEGTATQGTVSRTGPTNIARDVVVETSNANRLAPTSTTVTIPAGSSSATFDLNAIDDATFGPVEDRSVTITVSATWAENQVERAVVVIEDEQASPIDIDQDGSFSALNDGILALRFIAGFTGQSLTNNAVNNAGDRTDGAAITSGLESVTSTLDVDGNGQLSALADGILLLRYYAGFTGDSLTNNAVGANATRTTAAEVISFLDAERANTPGPTSSAASTVSNFQRGPLPFAFTVDTPTVDTPSVVALSAPVYGPAATFEQSTAPASFSTDDTDDFEWDSSENVDSVVDFDDIFSLPDALTDVLAAV